MGETKQIKFWLTDEDMEMIEKAKKLLNLDNKSQVLRVALRFLLKEMRRKLLEFEGL